MSVNGIGFSRYPIWWEAGKSQKNGSGISFADRMTDIVGTNVSENGRKTIEKENFVSDEKSEHADSQDSETKTEIIVKPDGSRVLVMTVSIGGMETATSMEISKPTKAPNENSGQDTDNQLSAAGFEPDAVLDEMSNISTKG